MEVTDEAVTRFIGSELQRRRKANGWARKHLVTLLPSKVSTRTLLSYEHGTRSLTMARFVELCRVLAAEPHEVLRTALERAVDAEHVSMSVHLPSLLLDEDPRFEAVRLWAERRMSDATEVLLVSPATAREMAAVMGMEHAVLAAYLSEFASSE